PGDLIGTLSVTLQPSATGGSSAALTLDAASTLLSNQSGTTSESVSLGTLALVNGSASCSMSAPSNLIATASGTSQVNRTWTADLRTGLDQARSLIGVPPISYADPSLVAGTTPVRAMHVQQLRDGVK